MGRIDFKSELAGGRVKLTNRPCQAGRRVRCCNWQAVKRWLRRLYATALLAPGASQRSDLGFKRTAIGRKNHTRKPGQGGFFGARDFILPQQKKACRLTWRKAVLRFLIQAVALRQYLPLQR